MDLVIPIFLYIFAIFFFIYAVIEERDEKHNEDEQIKADNIVVITLVLSASFLFIGGVCMMFITETYYSGISDGLIETAPMSTYRPLGWIGIGWGVFVVYLVINKVFDMMEIRTSNS